MIPLSDSRRRRRIPWATWSVALLCVGAFAGELALDDALPSFLERWAFTPVHLSHVAGAADAARAGVSLVVSLFLHASLLHLAGNLAFLLVFGDDVEDELGGRRFLGLFLGSGILASLAHWALEPRSAVPLVGASGAIAGLLAVFLVLHPRARLQGVLPLGCFFLPARSYAWIFVPLWFLIQLVAAFLELGRVGAPHGGVAWYAHVAGFAAGPILLVALGRPGRRRRRRVNRGRRS